MHTLRDAGFDNISFDLIYGIPGQSASDLESDLADALALEPEHLSCYELEAKPGTRFTHAHGDELARQAEAMEGYFEQVVETLTAVGYRWYETANFCVGAAEADGRDLRAHHNLAYWWGRDYLGVGIGAVSTLGGPPPSQPSEPGPLHGRAPHGQRPAAGGGASRRRDAWRGSGCSSASVSTSPSCSGTSSGALDSVAAERLASRGLVELARDNGGSTITLTRRGRFLGGGVTVELLAEA